MAAIADVRWQRRDYLRRVCFLLWDKRQWHEELQRRLPRRRYLPNRNGRGYAGEREREQCRQLNPRRVRVLRGIPPLPPKKLRQRGSGQSFQPREPVTSHRILGNIGGFVPGSRALYKERLV